MLLFRQLRLELSVLLDNFAGYLMATETTARRRWGRMNPPRPCSPSDSITSNGRCWKHDHPNFFGSTPNDFCADGATACLLSWLPHHKERPYTIPTSTSNLIYLEQGKAVLGLSSQVTVHLTSPVFNAVLQQWVMLSLGNGSESHSVLVRIIMDIVLATTLLHCTTA